MDFTITINLSINNTLVMYLNAPHPQTRGCGRYVGDYVTCSSPVLIVKNAMSSVI